MHSGIQQGIRQQPSQHLDEFLNDNKINAFLKWHDWCCIPKKKKESSREPSNKTRFSPNSCIHFCMTMGTYCVRRSRTNRYNCSHNNRMRSIWRKEYSIMWLGSNSNTVMEKFTLMSKGARRMNSLTDSLHIAWRSSRWRSVFIHLFNKLIKYLL